MERLREKVTERESDMLMETGITLKLKSAKNPELSFQ